MGKSSELAVTVPDSTSFADLIEKADAAVSAGQESSGMESFSRTCGIPDRLLLPKGNEQGLEFALWALVSDGSHDHTGIHGQKYPDLRPMGYPLDRQITNPRISEKITNFKSTYVKVYHKSN